MNKIRQPAVAGMFYPDNPRELQTQIDGFLAEAKNDYAAPKALIAPHAGYIYSGPVAASAYATIRDHKNTINRVVLLGPAHRVFVQGVAATSADKFLTPLGDVEIDQACIRELVNQFSFVNIADDVHAQEHSLEVHLPFLQRTLHEFSLIPLAVGEARDEEIDAILESLWGGSETLIVISSDLSHYHDYATAQRLDSATSDAIEHLQPERIQYEDACGRIPINGLLQTAKHRGLVATNIDLRNSGDTAGPHNQVVGYGAYLFHEASESPT
ncbi:MAG: AmmeMemoRadiSam system protein B [Gammaproteobacteria bacterium]|nr:AmmeMemoRadiSam system protein B [Gammaproteobacteria bacterium]